MPEHKNASRAPLRPLDLPTTALTTGGLGFLRPAPGTWGSVPPVLGGMVLRATGVSTPVVLGALVAVLLVSSAACVVWGAFAERRFGRKDAAEVVADETAGVCLPALAAVLIASPNQYALLTLAFILFRCFDITKPWPMARLERLPLGWGVLLDDLMAGAYAAAVLLLGAAIWNL